MKKYFIFFSLFFFHFIFVFAQEVELPNILVIHVDDLGYHDLSCTGSKIYQTPNIDGIAEGSISFTHAYTNYPRCVPSRYAMMTGTWPVIENKGKMRNIPTSQNYVKQLKKLGYRSGYVGKWHLGDNKDSPQNYGFDYSYAAGAAGGTGSRFFPFNTRNPNDKAPILDVEGDGKKGDYLSDLLTDATIRFMDQDESKAPFFVMLAFYAVHTPLEAKPNDRERNRLEIEAFDFGDKPKYINEGTGRRKMRQDDPDYAGMVENVDENIGRLLNYLEDHKLRDNTMIIFSSDHGGLSNDGRNTRHLATTNHPLRAGKGWLYEGGIRVPLFINWPGKIEPREENKSIVTLMDVFTTTLELVSGQPMTGIDGKSFKEVITGETSWVNRTIYWHSSKARPHSTGDSAASAIRAGDYKLIYYLDDQKLELFNLKTDPGEVANLIEEKPEIAQSLLEKLNSWKKNYKVKDNRKKKQ